jgi:poly(A) polymerase
MTEEFAAPRNPEDGPVVLERSAHPVSRRDIDPDALKVLYRLHGHGFVAYLVGGAVRDLLLGRRPQDFDIGTDARPGQVKRLFRNAFLIGRRFRLAHVRFYGGKVIEVATFRSEPEPDDAEAPGEDPGAGPPLETGVPTREEVKDEAGGEAVVAGPDAWAAYGTPREDAFRRDITINALFYDIATFSVIDYVGGLEDLGHGLVRMIGDPGQRFTEDPVRIWRAVRHAARLNFVLEAGTEQAIPAHRHLLAACPGARLYEELNKDLKCGAARPTFELLRRYGLLGQVLGTFGRAYESDDRLFTALASLLGVLDRSAAAGAPLAPPEAYALLFRPWVEAIVRDVEGDRVKALHEAFEAARTPAQIPRAVVTDVVQILAIVDTMMHALATGRMRWSLTRRAHYPAAARVFGLITEGSTGEGGDPFERTFRRAFGRGAVPDVRMRRRRPIRRPHPPEGPAAT